jgi:hypothetical protein
MEHCVAHQADSRVRRKSSWNIEAADAATVSVVAAGTLQSLRRIEVKIGTETLRYHCQIHRDTITE